MDFKARFQEHLEKAKSLYPEARIVGLFSIGSVNYNLTTVNSDLDTRMLIFPTRKDIALLNVPEKWIYEFPNGEHIEIFDVRHYFQLIERQNLNTLEIFWAQLQWINPDYKTLWYNVAARREEIAHLNEEAAMKSVAGMAYTVYKRQYLREEESADKKAKYAYQIARSRYYMEMYLLGASYEKCIAPTENLPAWQFLIDTKLGLKDRTPEMIEDIEWFLGSAEFSKPDEKLAAEILDTHIIRLMNKYFERNEE